jgi:hypothetical protein
MDTAVITDVSGKLDKSGGHDDDLLRLRADGLSTDGTTYTANGLKTALDAARMVLDPKSGGTESDGDTLASRQQSRSQLQLNNTNSRCGSIGHKSERCWSCHGVLDYYERTD